jgi:hypothetical protein
MNKQQIFDTVIHHLRTQGIRATNAAGQCVYRGENGTKCAFGVLIPDALYKPEMEGVNAYSVCERNPELGRLFPPDVRRLLSSLQSVHDMHGSFSGTDFECALKRIASEWRLTYTEPQGATA